MQQDVDSLWFCVILHARRFGIRSVKTHQSMATWSANVSGLIRESIFAAGYLQGQDIGREGQLTMQSTRAYAEELIPF